jgi:hypothetical protein
MSHEPIVTIVPAFYVEVIDKRLNFNLPERLILEAYQNFQFSEG